MTDATVLLMHVMSHAASLFVLELFLFVIRGIVSSLVVAKNKKFLLPLLEGRRIESLEPQLVSGNGKAVTATRLTDGR